MSVKGKKILVTGGLGFIGFNAACYFAKDNQVLVVDDGSRIGVEHNIVELKKRRIGFSKVDISYFKEFRDVFHHFKPDVVIHMAAQVAVTLSITNPVRDFRSNLEGSFHLLELARHAHPKPTILYASTNKVYGHSERALTEEATRYVSPQSQGFDENTPLAFETPYGCSKGAAEQYFVDYCKTYQIPTVIFRQSCIYGPHQYGMEDQGWLAWFVICALFNKPLTIFGNGKQVRDVLYIDDLNRLFELSIENIEEIRGEIFNIGGGPANTLSLLELTTILERRTGKQLEISFADWRLNDQKVYISDIRKAKALLGWEPKVAPVEGVEKLTQWVSEERSWLANVQQQQQHFKDQCDVSIVIPAKNEEENIDSVLDEVEFFMSSSPFSYEVIVVNDRSTDKTADTARQYPFVRVVDNQNNPGKGGALRTGFGEAKGRFIVMMDADYSHDASDLPAMIEEVRRHNGLVIGSRIIGGSEEYTRVRAFGNIVLTWLFGFCHGRYLSDALNGFKVFHRDIYSLFEYNANGYEIEIELLVNTLRLQRPITEIPSRERARRTGRAKSKVIKDGLLFCSRIIFECFRKPHYRRQTSPAEGGLAQGTVTEKVL